MSESETRHGGSSNLDRMIEEGLREAKRTLPVTNRDGSRIFVGQPSAVDPRRESTATLKKPQSRGLKIVRKLLHI